MNDIPTYPTCRVPYFTPETFASISLESDITQEFSSHSDLEELLKPIRYSALFSNPIATAIKRSKLIPTIDRPIIIITNPAAGGGKGMRHATHFMDTITEQRYARVESDVQFLMTRKDPAARTAAIVKTIKRYNPSKPPFILVFGGDGTVADVTEAVSQSSRAGHEATIVPCSGGTAGDMRRELGVPKKPAQLIKFLAKSKPAELDVMTASINDGPKRLLIHSQGNGLSGTFFLEVEEYRSRTGKSGMPMYIKAMVKSMPRTETFYVSVNGGPLIATGEVLTINSTSMGAIGRIPLPIRGGRLHILPVNPKLPGPLKPLPGIVTGIDAFTRGAAYYLGNESVIAPDAKLKFLDSSRIFDIPPGDRITLEFFDASGKPKTVASVLNGDPSLGTQRVVIEGSSDRISVLAADNSGFRIRSGMTTYRTIRGIARDGFITSSCWFKKFLPIKLFGAYEIYKDVADLSPEKRVTLDTSMLVGILSADIFNTWRFGTTPLIAELPLVIPPFELGSIGAKVFVDEIGNQTGIDELKVGETANDIAGLSGGFAAVLGFIKLVGVEAWNAATANINTALVKHVGGAGMAVEDAIIKLLGRFGGISIPFPLIILPPDYYRPLDPTRTPEII